MCTIFSKKIFSKKVLTRKTDNDKLRLSDTDDDKTTKRQNEKETVKMRAKNILPKEQLIGKRVYAYWNLHEDVWSLSDGSRVIGYCKSFEMVDVELRVRKGGHEQAKRENRKNVHAFAIGTIVKIDEEMPEGMTRLISYNHRKGDTFYDKATGESVKHLDRCYGGVKILHA
jgi:hypothetical protein